MHRKHELSMLQSFKACMRRDATLMWRNRVRSRTHQGSRLLLLGFLQWPNRQLRPASGAVMSVVVPWCCDAQSNAVLGESTSVLVLQIVYIYRMAQLFIVAFAAATLFLRTERHQNTLEDGRPYLGAILRQPSCLISTSRCCIWPLAVPPYQVKAGVSSCMKLRACLGQACSSILYTS